MTADAGIEPGTVKSIQHGGRSSKRADHRQMVSNAPAHLHDARAQGVGRALLLPVPPEARPQLVHQPRQRIRKQRPTTTTSITTVPGRCIRSRAATCGGVCWSSIHLGGRGLARLACSGRECASAIGGGARGGRGADRVLQIGVRGGFQQSRVARWRVAVRQAADVLRVLDSLQVPPMTRRESGLMTSPKIHPQHKGRTTNHACYDKNFVHELEKENAVLDRASTTCWGERPRLGVVARIVGGVQIGFSGPPLGGRLRRSTSRQVLSRLILLTRALHLHQPTLSQQDNQHGEDKIQTQTSSLAPTSAEEWFVAKSPYPQQAHARRRATSKLTQSVYLLQNGLGPEVCAPPACSASFKQVKRTAKQTLFAGQANESKPSSMLLQQTLMRYTNQVHDRNAKCEY